MMDPPLYRADIEAEARLLLLISAFTRPTHGLQGRTKLAKLDFLLRYPEFFRRALAARGRAILDSPQPEENNIERRMVRYRYGPWDPAYYALLGSLLARGLIETVPTGRYIDLRVTSTGRSVADSLARTLAWSPIAERANLLRSTFARQSGAWMKDFIYQEFPEVARAEWGAKL
jgi:hypothetical protein